MADPAAPTQGTLAAPQNRGVHERGTPFTVDKAETLTHRAAGPQKATPSYPREHERVLRDLAAIVIRHPVDGEERMPDLLALAASLSSPGRASLHARLANDQSTDAFAVYFRQAFPRTRQRFLELLAAGAVPEGPPVQQPAVAPGSRGAIVSERYTDVARDPSYIDNFTNSIPNAWYPNDRVFFFEYPDGLALRIAYDDLIKALEVPSELNRPLTEEELRRKYKLPPDVELPKSTAAGNFITVGNKVRFYRDPESGVIYPAPWPIPQTYLPRISRVVKEIETFRADQDLMGRATLPIFERILAMEWSAPRGFGSLLVRIGRRLQRGARAVRSVLGSVPIHEGAVPPPRTGTRVSGEGEVPKVTPGGKPALAPLHITGEPPTVQLGKYAAADCLWARVETGGGQVVYRVNVISRQGPQQELIGRAHREMLVAAAREAKKLGQSEFKMIADQSLPGSQFPQHAQRLISSGIGVPGSAKPSGSLGYEVTLLTDAVLASNALQETR